MRKKIAVFIIMFMMATSCAFAEEGGQFTGNDYLSLTNQKRLDIVTSLINDAKAGGVAIKQTPVSYCKKLDDFYAKHPVIKKEPLATVLKTLIIMEYDWEQKGVDKDALARQWLGDKTYQQNKIRLKK
ncbi:MAG: hypothetical protein NC933_05620 [Candidatus Omnitrophica bacterium]|nr:hypothetical protein [Candidatus Omnitrophota bacterium]